MMTTTRIYSLNNFAIYQTAVLAIAIVLYKTFLFIYLTTGSLYVLATFFQFPLPIPSASGDHKSDVLFYEFVFCFVLF